MYFWDIYTENNFANTSYNKTADKIPAERKYPQQTYSGKHETILQKNIFFLCKYFIYFLTVANIFIDPTIFIIIK